MTSSFLSLILTHPLAVAGVRSSSSPIPGVPPMSKKPRRIPVSRLRVETHPTNPPSPDQVSKSDPLKDFFFYKGAVPANSSPVPDGNISIRATLDFPANQWDNKHTTEHERRKWLGHRLSLSAEHLRIDCEGRVILCPAEPGPSILVCKGLDEIQRLHTFLSTYLTTVSKQ